MVNFFTADLHFNHAPIVGYCNRPFHDINHINQKLIDYWNQRVKKEDTVYHLGDFCFHGGMQGGGNKASYWEEQLHGKIIHVKGNHDRNNSVKALIRHAFLEFGGYTVMICHEPPMKKEHVPDWCHFVLCGHMHEKWKYHYKGYFHKATNFDGKQIIETEVPVINVGVDVWRFHPIRLDEIIAYYDKIVKKGGKHGKESERARERSKESSKS